MAGKRVALRLHTEQLRGIIHHRFLRGDFRPFPARAAENVERGMPLTHADVLGHEIGLLDRHVELALLGELKHEHLGCRGSFARAGQGCDSFVECEAMVEVDNVIAVCDFGEVERLRLAPQADEAFLPPQRAQRLVAATRSPRRSTQLSRPSGQTKPRRSERCRNVIASTGNCASRRSSSSSRLLLALVVAENGNLPLFRQPVA